MRLHLHCSKEAGLRTKRRFFLKERLSAVYITQAVFTGIGLEFVLRHPGGVDLTKTECFVKFALKSRALQARRKQNCIGAVSQDIMHPRKSGTPHSIFPRKMETPSGNLAPPIVGVFFMHPCMPIILGYHALPHHYHYPI